MRHAYLRINAGKSVSNFLFRYLVFILCNPEKEVLKNVQKLPVFCHEIKTKALKEKMRYSSLEMNLKNMHRRFQVGTYILIEISMFKK